MGLSFLCDLSQKLGNAIDTASADLGFLLLSLEMKIDTILRCSSLVRLSTPRLVCSYNRSYSPKFLETAGPPRGLPCGNQKALRPPPGSRQVVGQLNSTSNEHVVYASNRVIQADMISRVIEYIYLCLYNFVYMKEMH